MIVAGVLHSEWVEDVLLQNLLVPFASDAFDDSAEQKVTGVVVGKFGTRLELEIAAGIVFHKLVNLVGIPADVLEEARLARITRNAGSVCEQVMNGHLISDVLAVLREVIGELAVELDLPLFGKLKNDGRGKLLGDRSESELRVGSVGNVPLHI